MGELQGRCGDEVPGAYPGAEPARERQLALRHRRPRTRHRPAQVHVPHSLWIVADILTWLMECLGSALRSDRRADQAIGIIDRRANQIDR